MIKKLDKISIRNILTIRYNPEESLAIKPTTIRNFQYNQSDVQGLKTERLLKKVTLKNLEGNNGPFVVSLSGGIDSSLILGILRSVFPDKEIIAIHGIFEGAFDESNYARKTAKQFNAKFKIVRMNSLFENLPELIAITKKPKWNSYQHLIAKEAKKYGSRLITGDGADEIFAGYTFRYQKFLSLINSNSTLLDKVKAYLECHNRDWVPDQQEMFDSGIKFDWNIIYKYFKLYFKNSLKPIQQVLLADFNGKLLYDFIPTGNAICNNYKLIGFKMYLEPEMIKFGLSIPVNQKYDKKQRKGKLILRKIAKRIGVEHIDEKKGFSPSLWFDWKDNGKRICEYYLLDKDSNIFRKKFINYNWLLKAFEKIDGDGDIRYLHRLISVLTLEIWYRIFITNEIRPTQSLL